MGVVVGVRVGVLVGNVVAVAVGTRVAVLVAVAVGVNVAVVVVVKVGVAVDVTKAGISVGLIRFAEMLLHAPKPRASKIKNPKRKNFIKMISSHVQTLRAILDVLVLAVNPPCQIGKSYPSVGCPAPGVNMDNRPWISSLALGWDYRSQKIACPLFYFCSIMKMKR